MPVEGSASLNQPAQRPLLSAPSRTVSSGATAPLVGLRRRRPAVQKACEPCRKRKIKCNGVKPTCSMCNERNIPCEYSTEVKLSGREGAEIQQKVNEHEEVYGVLQTGAEATSLRLLKHIREGNDVTSSARYVQSGNLLLEATLAPETWTRYTFPWMKHMPSFLINPENLYLQSDLYLWVQQCQDHTGQEGVEKAELRSATDNGQLAAYRAPYHAAKIIDDRIDRADVSQWTQVAEDVEVLRELLRIYFLYDYPPFIFFHKDYFLDDLVSGATDHCSSLLVNAVLAMACHGYSKASYRTEFWNPKSLQYRFFAEMRRLRELEFGTETITSIQAACIVSTCCMMDGSDKVGWSYLVQALAMADHQSLFQEHAGTTSERMQKARELTAWQLFSWQSQLCFHYHRTPLLRAPPPFYLFPPATTDSEWFPEIWVQYPAHNKLIPLHLYESFKAHMELRVLMNDISIAAFPPGGGPARLPLGLTRVIYSRLEQWYFYLPPPMSFKRAIQPHELVIHMHYFNIIMKLLEPIADEDVLIDSLDGNGHRTPRLPKDIIHSAKVGLETVFRLHYLRHGFEAWNSLLLHFEVVLGYSALGTLSSGNDLSIEDRDATRSLLALAIKGLHEQGRHSHLGLTIYRFLCQKMQGDEERWLREHADLPEDDGDVIAWRKLHVDSQYPVNIVSIAHDPASNAISSLVAEYRAMGLQDHITPEM